MKNYVIENLIPVTSPISGVPAIMIGDEVFPFKQGSCSGGVDVTDTTATS